MYKESSKEVICELSLEERMGSEKGSEEEGLPGREWEPREEIEIGIQVVCRGTRDTGLQEQEVHTEGHWGQEADCVPKAPPTTW